MKQTFKLLAILIAVSFAVASCGGDKKKELVGTWEYQKTVSEVETSDAEATTKIKSFLEDNMGGSDLPSLEFTEEGTVTMPGQGNRNYSISGDELTISMGQASNKMKFSIDGNTLKLLIADEEVINMVKGMLQLDESVKIEKADVYAYFVRKK